MGWWGYGTMLMMWYHFSWFQSIWHKSVISYSFIRRLLILSDMNILNAFRWKFLVSQVRYGLTLKNKYYDGICYGICGHIATGLFLLNKSGVHIISLVKQRWVHSGNIIVLQRTCREFLWLSNKKNRVQIRAKLASSVPSMYKYVQAYHNRAISFR